MSRRLREQPISAARYGWKAFHLGLLTREHFRVPDGIALAIDEEFSPEDLHWLNRDCRELSLAVRSSSRDEDSTVQSLAGSFQTFLEVKDAAQVGHAVAEIRSAAGHHDMGIVVQQLIRADISGVAFSVNPGTYEYAAAAVSWVEGLGAGLVSGSSSGHDVLVDTKSAAVINGDWPHESELLLELLNALSRLAKLLGGPVDVEWCVEHDTRELYMLQVRPVVLPPAQTVDLDRTEQFQDLPAVVAGHPKIKLRRMAAQLGVSMTPARATIGNCRDPLEPKPIDRDARAAGSSVVLLHPFRVDDRVVREFAKVDETDVDFITRECRRYSIRQYPSFDDIAATEKRVLARGLDAAALAVVLEQEIWDAHVTGIVRILDDGYLVEVALGHFVPKGYVQTSAYLLDFQGSITARHEAHQDSAFHFYNGHVVREDEPEDTPWLADATVKRIIDVLDPLMQRVPHLALEFGITEPGAKGRVYLIDAAESDDPGITITTPKSSMDIISQGRAQGIVVDLRARNDREDLDAHLYQRVAAGGPGVPAIFIAERASVDLLPLLYGCPPGCGFLFEQASLLSHFAVVLRERGVPGAVVPPDKLAVIAKAVTAALDTTSPTIVEQIDTAQ